jgi:two-component system sensor histidine kinase TctE
VRSTHLIHQLLTLARAEPQAAARQDLQRLDVRALTVQVTADLVPRALRERIDLGVDETSSEEPIWIAANPLLMREAIFNIVDNALRYAGAQAVVTVKVTRDQGSAVIEVQDNGPGIAPADHARVFERFVRGTETGDGCGLGLPIVKEIIEHHAGQVLLQNVQPRGLRVRVELPVSLP